MYLIKLMVLAMIMQRYQGAYIHVHKIILTSSIDEGLMEGKGEQRFPKTA